MVILREVKMFPRNSSEGQVSQMGGPVSRMGGQVHGDLGKQVQRLSLAEEALTGDRRDLLAEAASAPAIAGCFPGTDMDLGSLASREKA